MPIHAPVVRLLSDDDGGVEAVSAGGLSSVCVVDTDSGAPVDVCSVIRVIYKAERLVAAA